MPVLGENGSWSLFDLEVNRDKFPDLATHTKSNHEHDHNHNHEHDHEQSSVRWHIAM